MALGKSSIEASGYSTSPQYELYKDGWNSAYRQTSSEHCSMLREGTGVMNIVNTIHFLVGNKLASNIYMIVLVKYIYICNIHETSE
jgi:hypothetical protein